MSLRSGAYFLRSAVTRPFPQPASRMRVRDASQLRKASGVVAPFRVRIHSKMSEPSRNVSENASLGLFSHFCLKLFSVCFGSFIAAARSERADGESVRIADGLFPPCHDGDASTPARPCRSATVRLASAADAATS